MYVIVLLLKGMYSKLFHHNVSLLGNKCAIIVNFAEPEIPRARFHCRYPRSDQGQP